MERKIRIELDLGKCIGNKACVAQDPEHFGFDLGKAVLKGSLSNGSGICVLEGTFSPEGAENLRHAAEVCPVNAISYIEGEKEVIGSTIDKTPDFKRIEARYDDAEE